MPTKAKYIEEMAVTLTRLLELSEAAGIPLKVEANLPEIELSKVEPMEIYADQLRGKSVSWPSGNVSVEVRVYGGVWRVPLPYDLWESLQYTTGKALLPEPIRQRITEYVLENS